MDKFISAIIIGIIGVFVESYCVMIGVGIIHGEWLHNVPTLGYWHAFLVGFALVLVATPLSVSWTSDK